MHDYRWQAWVDRPTGVAGSHETSLFHDKCMPTRHVVESFIGYPEWLASPRVSFGFLQARPCFDGGADVKLFGIWSVLRFGRHRLSRTERRIKTERWTEETVTIPMLGGFMVGHPARGSLLFSVMQSQTGVHKLETQIVHGYNPALCGRPPVSRIRASSYRCTQSLLHAYVMWRFHNRVASKAECESGRTSRLRGRHNPRRNR